MCYLLNLIHLYSIFPKESENSSFFHIFDLIVIYVFGNHPVLIIHKIVSEINGLIKVNLRSYV